MALLVGSVLAACTTAEAEADYNVIPLPKQITAGEGDAFVLNHSTVIACADTSLKRDAELLAEYIGKLSGHTPEIVSEAPQSNVILLQLGDENDNPEAYTLTVDKDRIIIGANTSAGVFYGIQTLRKSIPGMVDGKNVRFAPVTISDWPRFAYRGAHLDVSRHIFPVDSIKTFIDMLALHNINRFHWHITDDQGWRIEIKSRPLLTELGSKRAGTCIGHDMNTSDSIPYGGFFTQEEARDIVRYAADRHITVIPEIDLPGHMLGALKAYPELGCTGGPYEVWQRWGVSEDVLCAGNDDVLEFIDDVLAEIIDIFPSEYIHIGGDECPKLRWKECPKCQAKARELGLKDGPKGTVEQQLQSYIIHHASDWLTSHGRKMIGWDETLEGGLAPGAVVMSWQTEQGAVEAARQGHDAIMTPTGYCYFDYYQTLDRDEGEPDAAGGYIPVEKVYSFNPLPNVLTDEEKSHILGVQANIWTEYIPTFSGVQYASLPRMAALSEVQWCDPEQRDFQSFAKRLAQLIAHYDVNGYRYATHLYNISGKMVPVPEKKAVELSLFTIDDAPIYYTTDGSVPDEKSTPYTAPLMLDSTCTVRAIAVRPGGNSKVFADSVTFNKATFGKITLAEQPHPKYAGNGALTLVDGKFGTDIFADGNWLGFQASDLDAVIDLGDSRTVSSVAVRDYVEPGAWIYDTPRIIVEGSDDGKIFRPLASREFPVDQHHTRELRRHKVEFAPQDVRYIRIKVESLRQIPQWHTLAAGNPAFIFVDEIIVD